ncbi:MAG: helicase-related protein [Candidatus Woesearchaeota archaeon]|jgi:helicase|nr:helicase-related protein [Candidatus Woesearchaeota archaeon]
MEEYCIIESEKVKTSTDDSVINLVLQTMEQKKQVLVFNNSKRSSESTAEKISVSVKNVENKEELLLISKKIIKALSVPTKQCKRLASFIEKGVAFHHSGLVSKQRDLVEKGFKNGFIRVISSTPTLAAGLNLPAYKVIIKDYKRYSQRGMADIPILEYHQMSGRAGRPGKEDIGKAVICVKTEDEAKRIVPKYVFGESEEIISKLAVEPTLKMYVLSLISMDMINTKEEIEKFFASTLYAHQYQDLESLNYNIFRIIEVLKDYNFVNQTDDYYMATQLGKKVSELYLNPDTANYFLDNLSKFVKRFESADVSRYDLFSLINFMCNTIEMRPLFNVAKAQEEDYVKRAEDVGDSLIVSFDPYEIDYDNFLNSIKTTDVLIDWISEAPEDYISDKYKITPGELSFKTDVVDWLLYCLEELSYLRKYVYFKNFLNKLRTRFKSGIKEELLSLISLKGIGRVRARKLYNAGFKRLLDLKRADYYSISRVVGDGIAIKIKKQLNENTEIKETTIVSRPKEIKVRDVSEDELDVLIENYRQFEEEKKEKNMSLTDYF